MRLSVQLRLLLLLSVSAPVPATSLAGSCVEAGFAECCDLGQGEPCVAPPTYCLCDPSCHEHDDCCDDIGEICSSGYSQPAAPIALLATDVTFHTATLLWGIPTDTAANDTYTIIYWEYGTTLTRNVSTVHRAGEQFAKTFLTSLEAGVLYVWLVEASNGRAVSQSGISNFSTLSYARIDGLRVEVYNLSALLVAWQPLQLPYGVQLQEYMVHYTSRKTTDNSKETGNAVARKNYAIISDLSSDTFYHFWVEAVVMDGALHAANGTLSSTITIFVPDTALIQLRGGPFKPCSSWTREIEVQTLDAFRSFIHQTIHVDSVMENRHEGGDGELIGQDFVFCDSDLTSRQSQAVYRATVHSTPHHSIEMIVSLIEDQVLKGDEVGLQIDTECPVRPSLASAPLCGEEEQPATTDCPKSDPTSQPQTHTLGAGSNCSLCEEERRGSSPVTLPVLVTALVAELFLFIFVGMAAVAIVLLVKRRRLLANDDKTQPQRPVSTTQPNTYS